MTYVILWDQGPNGEFIALVGESSPNLVFTLTIINGVDSGQIYNFKYYAVNKHGNGIESDVYQI